MTDSQPNAPTPTPAAGAPPGDVSVPAAPAPNPIAELASRPDARRPQDIPEVEWRRHRIAQGHMVLVRSHFKSIYLVPMAILSLICGIWMAFVSKPESEVVFRIGITWTFAFAFYMSLFIFEWSRSWTWVLLSSLATLIFLAFAVDSTRFPVWKWIADRIRETKLGQTEQTYFFYAIFFGFCAFASWVRTRFNYVLIDHNEIELNRNAWFGDRERIPLQSPRIEVRIPDMLEYFHPFYRAGQIIIHAPDRTLVLDNVLHIRSIERILSRLTGTMSVEVEKR